jgi:hypothetical protein
VRPRTLALVLPVVFAIHNSEEALTIGPSLPMLKARLSGWAPGWTDSLSLEVYQPALLLVTLLGCLVGAWVLLRPQSCAALWTLLLLQSLLLLNVFSHLAMAALLRGYAPGVLTAVLLNFPLSLYVFRTAARQHWLGSRALLALIPAAVAVHGPLLVGLLAFFTNRAA